MEKLFRDKLGWVMQGF